MPPHSKPPESRFWAKVNKNGTIPQHCPELGPCWIYAGCTDKNGYGIFELHAKKAIKAHRYAYSLAHGEIPHGKDILHHCDNPPCVNDRHLYVGTQADNSRDMVLRGRESHAGPTHPSRGESHRRATTTEQTVLELRKLSHEGASSRHLARKFNLTRSCVQHILRHRSWKHVT